MASNLLVISVTIYLNNKLKKLILAHEKDEHTKCGL